MTAKPLSPEDAATIAYLRSPTAIRERCGQLFDLACADKLQYFRCDLSQLERVADYVLQVTRESYPDLNIPFHSRWRHFEVGNQDRLTALDALAPLAKAKAKFDLAIVSVLLDAGAGDRWQYKEPDTGTVWRRSEGLAIASLHAFCQGIFSSDPQLPLQADAIGLQNLTEEALSQAFQVSQDNPLVGVSGRLALLQRLGTVIQQQPTLFGSQPARPGELVAYLCDRARDGDRADTGQIRNGQLEASTVLSGVLEGFGAIWAGRLTLAEVNLGDVWVHSALASTLPEASSHPSPYILQPTLVPFHKLSQWLTYSLLEPLQELGLTITGLDALTGLPEYRNGGLCVDLGLLQIKDPIILQQAHSPGSEAIVEWRALTVILLDRLAETIRQTLNLSATDLPLVKILQGGTWTAGRRIASTLRTDGSPPIQIESDGTVF
jgi:hypothetical protein